MTREIMKITSAVPGNLFFLCEDICFSTNHTGAGNYDVFDHAGVWVQRGNYSPVGAIILEPLPPGYYELVCRNNDHLTRISFGVLCEGAAVKSERIGVNTAAAWLSHPVEIAKIAAILGRVGVRWIRERFSWGETQQAPGHYDWGIYDHIVNTFFTQGMQIVEVFHDSPLWTHHGDVNFLSPTDLRHVYSFAKAAAGHFAGRVQAWEVWNEADTDFWPNLADRFAGIQKAAFLGFKSGSGSPTVLLSSLCLGANPFARNLLRCGVTGYFDIFNFHTYLAPESYPEKVASYRNILKENGAFNSPIWLTEAGIRLKESNGLLSPQDQILQAEFISKSIVMALAGGVDRYFYFMLPHYLENTLQFGCLRSDLSPYPGFLALAACIRLLGESVYLGKYEAHDRNVEIYLFHDGQRQVAVAWANRPRIVHLEAVGPILEVADIFGRCWQRETVNGQITLLLSPMPVYLYGVSDKLVQPVNIGPMTERNQEEPVSMRSYIANAPVNRETDCCVVPVDESVEFCIEICNFSEIHSVEVEIRVQVPIEFQADCPNLKLKLKPMAREVLRFEFRCRTYSKDIARLVVTGRANAREIAPSVTSFSVDSRVNINKQLFKKLKVFLKQKG